MLFTTILLLLALSTLANGYIHSPRIALRLHKPINTLTTPSCTHSGLQAAAQDLDKFKTKETEFTVKDIAVLPFNGVVQSRLWGLYSSAISSKGARALLTKSGSSFIGFLMGDLFSQMFMTSATFNLIRFLRMGSFGALIHAPLGHVFYRKLEKQFPGSSRSAVAKKVLVDQLLWAPLFALLLFSYSGLLAGHSLPATVAAIKTSKSVWTYYAASSLLLWPAAHYVNFTTVPPNKRLLFVNSVQVFFNTIVAGIAATFVAGLAA